MRPLAKYANFSLVRTTEATPRSLERFSLVPCLVPLDHAVRFQRVLTPLANSFI